MNSNEASAKLRVYIHDPLESSHRTIYRHSNIHGSISCDSGICDGLNNCHLAEPWAVSVNQQINLSITQISSEIPILNPYESMRACDGGIHESIYAQRPRDHQHHELLIPCHPQQQLFRGGFSGLDELRNGQSSTHLQLKVPMTSTANVSESRRVHVNSCIKFQDRNKKLDFKVNFREENRKANRCFHRDDSKSPKPSSDNNIRPSQCISSDNVVHPPKKKWIRHYIMTGNFGVWMWDCWILQEI